jgi:hypothetical protein
MAKQWWLSVYKDGKLFTKVVAMTLDAYQKLMKDAKKNGYDVRVTDVSVE